MICSLGGELPSFSCVCLRSWAMQSTFWAVSMQDSKDHQLVEMEPTSVIDPYDPTTIAKILLNLKT